MKKSELNPYMLLETRCGEKMRFIRDCFVTDKLEILDQDAYTEDLIYAYNDEQHDIVKVYEEDSEAVKWERQEIDWSKVPIGTKVLVRDYDDEKWKNRLFIKVVEGVSKTKNFDVIPENGSVVANYKQCKLAEEPVTIEDMANLMPCKLNSNSSCKNLNISCKHCISKAILENYNVIRK